MKRLSRATSRPAPEPIAHRRAWATRAAALRAALGAPALDPTAELSSSQLGEALSDVIDVTDRSHVWLALSVLTGVLPDTTTVIETSRYCEFDGGSTLWAAVVTGTTDASAGWTVRIVSDVVLVDVALTAETRFTTGIQRVVRETVRRWVRDHGSVTLASWTKDFQSLRTLTPPEHDRALGDNLEADDDPTAATEVLVPWNATYLLPELGPELNRTSRLAALAEFMPGRTGVIGFDTVPITSSETTSTGFADYFARNLAAVRRFDVVSTISRAAGDEYGGWRESLSAIGVEGPRIVPVLLPVEIPDADPESAVEAGIRFRVGRLPIVLVVGSHEPRKNHLAVLHAAELLWREGVQFSLSFVGGGAWGGDAFSRRILDLQRIGRPVDTESKLSDRLLWEAYRLAHITVFPSFNEGFGLPLAESLAAGVPAVTSNFGSMREIAEDGGALMVDPHDDRALTDAIRTLLTDRDEHARLAAQARARAQHPRTWDDYAAEVWTALVGDPAPSSQPLAAGAP
jgi:glycosyltransferase involved in cell wall biosynthesis